METLLIILANTWFAFKLIVASPFQHGFWVFIYKFIPFVVFIELPVYIFIWLGIMRYYLREDRQPHQDLIFYPSVSCIVTCYSEGEDVKNTIISLTEQLYQGRIEILAMIDGARQNLNTYNAAQRLLRWVAERPNRTLKVIPKWQRGGRVSSLNAGLTLAQGEIVMALDGDTSFDNTMVKNAVRHFADPNVVGVAGNLRVRNARKSLITRLQAIEYMLSIHAAKIGLSEFNVVNNISGAFGIFRRRIVEKVGGWDSGTAEDLDITLKIKAYFGRHPNLRIVFEPNAIGHTDAPENLWGLLDQRLRWDGDLYYSIFRKHALSFNSRIVGLRNLIMTMWTGLFFQLVMPLIIVIYSVVIFTLYPPYFILAVWPMVYMVYLGILTVIFVTYVTLVSERKLQDWQLAPLLPIVP